MKSIKSSRQIQADLEKVFETISDVRNFSKAVPAITKVEFITEQKSGAGTRFLETRKMGKREHTCELAVTEFSENESIRIVSDAGGTVWDSIFKVRKEGEGVELTLEMEARPHKFLAKILNPLIRGMVVKGLESDMDSVKAYCEGA